MSNLKRYDGSNWQPIEIDADKLGGKMSSSFQDKLISGTNIKTINGSNILGSGNVTISASVPTASSTTLGGIKIGFNNPSNLSDYPVQLDASNKAYVNIPIYYYEGATYGECYEIDAPSYEYSMAIGTSGFTVDSGVPGGNTGSSNILQVDSDKFTYNGNQVITSGNLKTINGNSLVGSGNLGIPTYPGDNFFIKRVASYSNGACLYKRPSGQTSLPRLYNVLTPWNVYLILPYQSPWFTFNYGDLQQWPAIAFLEIASGYNFFLRVYIKDSPYVYEWQNEDMSTNVVAFWNCTIYKIGR